MSLKGAAYIVGAWEHPTRKATDKSVALLHAECAKGALEDAGLTKDDVDGYFCAGDAPGSGPAVDGGLHEFEMRHVDATDVGGRHTRWPSATRWNRLQPDVAASR